MDTILNFKGETGRIDTNRIDIDEDKDLPEEESPSLRFKTI